MAAWCAAWTTGTSPRLLFYVSLSICYTQSNPSCLSEACLVVVHMQQRLQPEAVASSMYSQLLCAYLTSQSSYTTQAKPLIVQCQNGSSPDTRPAVQAFCETHIANLCCTACALQPALYDPERQPASMCSPLVSSWLRAAGHYCRHAGGCEHRHQLGASEDWALWGGPPAGVPGGPVLWGPALLPHHPPPGTPPQAPIHACMQITLQSVSWSFL